MKQVIPVSVTGVSAKIPRGFLEAELSAREVVKERVYGGRLNGRWIDAVKSVPIFIKNNTHIRVGLGAILFLAKNNPFIDLEFKKFEPDRSKMDKIIVPEGVRNAPKFRVNGKDRWYFYEALEACRGNYCGTVKLPTGSGKTVIELTLAYNQARQIGTGIIIVPTHTIKEQFVKSASLFGLKMRDYREWLYDLEYTETNDILIATPGVVCNDLVDDDLHNAKHELIKWIIADECHHSGCETWYAIFDGLPNLTRSHGFSALPVEEKIEHAISFSQIPYDDALTISAVGPIIYEKSTKQLNNF